MRTLRLAAVLLGCGIALAGQSAPSRTAAHDGNWWLSVSQEKQNGFLEGSGDCLTWLAHQKNFSGTSAELRDPITRYYQQHSSDKSLPVISAWQKVLPDQKDAEKPDKDESAEMWKNPHWYLNGDWWRQATTEEQEGFVEGFLSCVRTHVKGGAGTYPGSSDQYRTLIDRYIERHPESDDQSIASVLARFGSKPASK